MTAQYGGKDSEIQIKSSNETEKQKELDGGAAGRWRLATA